MMQICVNDSSFFSDYLFRTCSSKYIIKVSSCGFSKMLMNFHDLFCFEAIIEGLNMVQYVVCMTKFEFDSYFAVLVF